jgi:hypothetical protein
VRRKPSRWPARLCGERRPDHITEQLLRTSLLYVTDRRSIEVAIQEARAAGWSDDEVCRTTGLSRLVAEAVAGRNRAA